MNPQRPNVKLRTDLFLHMMCGRGETTLGSSFEHEERVCDFIRIVESRVASFVDHPVLHGYYSNALHIHSAKQPWRSDN